jgi:hypothetical protein
VVIRWLHCGSQVSVNDDVGPTEIRQRKAVTANDIYMTPKVSRRTPQNKIVSFVFAEAPKNMRREEAHGSNALAFRMLAVCVEFHIQVSPSELSRPTILLLYDPFYAADTIFSTKN